MSIGLPSVLLSDRRERYSRGGRRNPRYRPSVEHGVNDTPYSATIATSQVSKAVNYDLSAGGELETRGGSIKTSNTAVSSVGNSCGIHMLLKRDSDGTLTRIRIKKSGTKLYKFNSSTVVWDEITLGFSLSASRASMVNFISTGGAEVMVYADGTNFFMYDGTTVISILPNFLAGNGGKAPRYLFVKHSVLFASGDDTNPDILFWCDPLKPDSDWPSQGFAILEGGVDKITGIGQLYNYIVVTCLSSIYLVTGRTSATFSLFAVHSGTGCTSHWSIVSEGGFIYWANAAGFHVGKLRAAEDDGMDVEFVSQNMTTTFKTITAGYWDEIQGVYDDTKKSIYWTIKTGSSSQPDKLFVFSAVRSQPSQQFPQFGPDLRFVWSGYYSGLDFNGVGVLQNSNGEDELHVVDGAGFSYQLHTGYKDKRAVSAETGTNIAYEVRTRAETFGGAGVTARVLEWFPALYSRHNSGFSIQFLIDNTLLFPTTPQAIKFTGNTPFWHDGTDPAITAEWNSTVWSAKAILNAKVGLKQKCYSIIAIITSDGSNAHEEGTWVGYDMLYQRDPIPQGKAA